MLGGSSNGLRKKLLRKAYRDKTLEEKRLSEFVKRISARIPDSTIVLFGSRARGESLPYSDYDIAVIVRRLEDRISETEQIMRLKPRSISVDLILLEQGDLEDPLIRKMLEGSKILYDKLGLKEKIEKEKLY